MKFCATTFKSRHIVHRSGCALHLVPVCSVIGFPGTGRGACATPCFFGESLGSGIYGVESVSDDASRPAGYERPAERVAPFWASNAEIVPLLRSSTKINLPVRSFTMVPNMRSASGPDGMAPEAGVSSILWFTTRTASCPSVVLAKTVPVDGSEIREEIEARGTVSSLLIAPVTLSTVNALSVLLPATIRFLPIAATKRAESGVRNGDPGTTDKPPSLLISKPRIKPAPGSAVNRNCFGTTANMGVGVGVGVGVMPGLGKGVGVGLTMGVAVGEKIGVGDGDGPLTTILRGEIVPHAAIIASSNNSKQADIQLETAGRISIVKRDAAGKKAVGRAKKWASGPQLLTLRY
jgi:hypothetical protein